MDLVATIPIISIELYLMVTALMCYRTFPRSYAPCVGLLWLSMGLVYLLSLRLHTDHPVFLSSLWIACTLIVTASLTTLYGLHKYGWRSLVLCGTLDQQPDRGRHADILQTVADSTYDWEYWIGPDQYLRYVSPSCMRITGYYPQEFLSDPTLIEHIVHPDDYLRVRDYLHAVSPSTQDTALQFRIITRQGETRWIDSVSQPVYDQQGNWQGQCVSSRDSTAVIQSQEEVRINEERFRSMFERHHAIMLLIDPLSGAIVECNRAAEAFYGYTHDQLCALNISAINRLSPAMIEQERRRAEAEQCNYFVFPHQLASGEVRTVEVHSSPIVVQGQRLLFSIIHDISTRVKAEAALHKSQARLKAVFDNAAVGISLIDIHGRHIEINERWAEMLGYSMVAMYQKTYLDFTHPDDRAMSATLLRSLIDGERSGYRVQKRYVQQDGSVFWGDLSVTAIRNTQDELEGVLGIVVDITEQKQSELALRQANARLTDWVTELEQRTQEITLLSELSAMLQRCATVEEAYAVIAGCARQLFPADSGMLGVRRSTQQDIEPVIRWGDLPMATRAFAPDECWALRGGQVHMVEDVQHDLICRHIDPLPTTRTLCVPLIAQGETFGVLHLQLNPDYREREMGLGQRSWEAKQQLVLALAEQVALALANVRLREKLRHQAIHDALTGLFNRRYLNEMLEREMRRSTQSLHSVGVVLFDIDHFKQFNDTYGHDGGDALLAAVGDFLQAQVRGADIACRYGGEEFILVLPGASLEDTRRRAEQVRRRVERLQAQHKGCHLGSITVSLGVAAFPEHGMTAEAVIKAADTALYQAKAAGRNRVMLASQSTVQ